MTPAFQVTPLPSEIDWRALARRAAQSERCVWLDHSASPAGPSLIATDPLAEIVQFDGHSARFMVAGRIVDEDPSVWSLLQRVSARLGGWPAAPHALGPGWIGYIGFEAAAQLERLPRSHELDLGLPLVRLGLFDRVLLREADGGAPVAVEALGLTERLTGLGANPPPREPDWMAEIQTSVPPAPHVSALNPVEIDIEHSRWSYDHMVQRALDYIFAGDIYQVNLCHRLRIENFSQPFERYLQLRVRNPAPYGAYLSGPEGCVLSCSPELFLQVRGREVLTSPIKGTRPRTGDAEQDSIIQADLLASPKDAAELAMIIDLHRNDLGRACEIGSVKVREARRLESHPRVFHTVADITGTLAAGRMALDVLAAAFPAGSISGVPKIRALQIIDELESNARGVYTGAIGAIGLDGQMTMSVAIRNIQSGPGGTALYVGGGIVADSDPDAEYDETLTKARGILEGLGAGQPGPIQAS